MPNKNNNRMGRIDEEYRKELSQIIGFELKNSSITGMISVTKVKVTPDLKYAKVYVSIFNSKNIKETMEGLKKSSGFIRTELAKRINLRNTPELIFEIDDSMEYRLFKGKSIISSISAKVLTVKVGPIFLLAISSPIPSRSSLISLVIW